MVEVQVDIIDGNKVERTRKGWRATRLARVTGLTGAGHERVYNAYSAPGMPAYNSAHPSIPGIYLKEMYFDTESGSPTQAKVRLVYLPLRFSPMPGSDARIRVGATVEQESTYEDIDGNVMFVEYDDGTTVREQGGTVSVLRPKVTREYVREEDEDPGALAEAYVGTVNEAGWYADPTAPARVWLCNDIASESTDGGETFTVRYMFTKKTHRPTFNWDVFLQWMDPQTGRPPKDLVVGVGTKSYQIAAESNFNALNLVSPP